MADPTLILTPEVLAEDGKNRVTRTGFQAGTASALIVVGRWVAQQFGWSGNLDPEVVLALSGLLTTLGAWITNRKRIGGQI